MVVYTTELSNEKSTPFYSPSEQISTITTDIYHTFYQKYNLHLFWWHVWLHNITWRTQQRDDKIIILRNIGLLRYKNNLFQDYQPFWFSWGTDIQFIIRFLAKVQFIKYQTTLNDKIVKQFVFQSWTYFVIILKKE